MTLVTPAARTPRPTRLITITVNPSLRQAPGFHQAAPEYATGNRGKLQLLLASVVVTGWIAFEFVIKAVTVAPTRGAPLNVTLPMSVGNGPGLKLPPLLGPYPHHKP